MDICPSIRTTDALGRYVLRHRVHAGHETIVAHSQALSVRQRLFSSSRGSAASFDWTRKPSGK